MTLKKLNNSNNFKMKIVIFFVLMIIIFFDNFKKLPFEVFFSQKSVKIEWFFELKIDRS